MATNISVIVPVYNASSTLERCVKSILSQTLQEFELILIDDGSEDDSVEIMQRLAHIDERLVVMYQKHSGVSAARNYALKQAKGKYICFVDADDYVEANYLSVLYEHREYDLVICGYVVDYEDDCGNLIRQDSHSLLQTGFFDIHNGCDVLYSLFESGSMHINCNKLYRADIIHSYSISYPDIPINEDYAFVIKYLAYARNLYAESKSPYHWVRIANQRTGVDSMPDNLIDIYTDACEKTKALFMNPKLVDHFFYHTYELVARKYMNAMRQGAISRTMGYTMLQRLMKHPSVKSSFRMRHPKSIGAFLPHYLLRLGLFGLYKKIYL